MIKRLPLYLIIIVLITGLNYMSTSSLISSIIVGIVGILTFLVLIEPTLSKFFVKTKKMQECVWFINNFLITLSINQSIRLTFENLKESFSKEMRQQVKLNEHLDIESQIKYLKTYFNCDLYNVFVNLLDQYIYNGGDILKISQILLFDARKTGDEIDNHLVLFKRKIFELGSLWILNFLVLIILKFSLNQFYDSIANNQNYIMGIAFFFVIFYFNCYLLIAHASNSLRFLEKRDNSNKKEHKKLKFKFKRKEVKNEKVKRNNAKGK